MTRSDLVARLAERFAQLGHRIEIRGFGSFSINRRPPRVGRNPRSGEQVVIPEKLVPHFKPGKALRESVDAHMPLDADGPATER
ncbi:MAG: HU family DNA-binding protein [Burkholderiaceae bacterium]|nr:HU family DNA-binding protein [Burkholderiaceae bacterium]